MPFFYSNFLTFITNSLTSITSKPDSAWERFFVGCITGAVMYLFFTLINRRKDKKQKKEDELELERLYYKTLEKIVHESGIAVDFDYDKTTKQLIDRCNPKYFLEPYQPEKLAIATELYSTLRNRKSLLSKL